MTKKKKKRNKRHDKGGVQMKVIKWAFVVFGAAVPL
jgi:hypothetical protein